MLTDTQKQELDKIKFQYDKYIDLYNSKQYKDYQSLEKQCIKIFYSVIISWARWSSRPYLALTLALASGVIALETSFW